ncbi:MAG: hypothetical protein DRR06_15695, partial [Gammaproteobacteria bacterium]
MTDKALETLGKKIDGKQGRDAVHIAMLPLQAGHELQPGEHIGIVDNKANVTIPTIGIVDPFLPENVKEGEWCWVMVYPRTITALKHEWSHPMIDRILATRKEQSKQWIEDYIQTADCPDYHSLINTIIRPNDSWDDDYLHFDGQDAHGSIDPELYDHVAIVTGEEIDNRPKYFS